MSFCSTLFVRDVRGKSSSPKILFELVGHSRLRLNLRAEIEVSKADYKLYGAGGSWAHYSPSVSHKVDFPYQNGNSLP